MPSRKIKQHYISLVKLLKVYRDHNVGVTHIQATHRFCQSLLEVAKSNPDLVYAQPQLYKTQLPFIANLAFNSCVMTCLIAVRKKVDESVIIQLMSAAISLIASDQTSINERYLKTISDETNTLNMRREAQKALIQQLKRTKQQVWLTAYSAYPLAHKAKQLKLEQLGILESIVYLGIRFALLCTPNKLAKPLKFLQAFKQLCLQSPPHWLQTLEPLLKYPTLSPPGTIIKHQDGILQIVLSISEQGPIVKPMRDAHTTKNTDKTDSYKIICVKKSSQCYAAQSLKNLNKLKEWWNEDLEAYYLENHEAQRTSPFEKRLPLQSAPPALLIIQDQLSNINIDIAVITKAIEKEPTYTQQLQQSATDSNRQKHSVETIQHSLAMLGFERASNILLEHSLLSRLNQEYFPLQQQVLIFSNLYASITRQLAKKTKSVTVEMASSTAYFVLSRLFTISSLKTQLSWKTIPNKHFRLSTLIQANGNETLKNGAQLLAQAWQQNKTILHTLAHYDSPDTLKMKGRANQLSYILGISLIMSKELYLQSQEKCSETQNYINNALIELDIKPKELDLIKQKAVENTTIYSPIR